MAVTYNNDVKDDRLQVVLDAIDAGSGAGYIEICTAAYASVLATVPLANPAGAVSGQVLTFDADPDLEDASADNTGVAAIARIKDSDGNIVISGLTVGTSGSDINLTSTSITSGDSVTITTATITHG